MIVEASQKPLEETDPLIKNPSILVTTCALMGLMSLKASALTLTTVDINNYTANGDTNNEDLSNRVKDADDAGSSFQQHGQTWMYDNPNTSAQAWLFTGTNPGIRQTDVTYFSGHGNENGPFLGYYSAYTGMYPSNYYWGSVGVRWMISDSCLNLYDGNKTNVTVNWSSGTYAINRWWQAIDWAAGSLHSFCGHRSEGWDVQETGHEFFDRALGNGEAIGQSWFDASYDNEYVWWGWYYATPGVEPAVLSCIADGRDYFNENLQSPWPDPQNATNKYQVSYHYAYYGTPQFPSWL